MDKKDGVISAIIILVILVATVIIIALKDMGLLRIVLPEFIPSIGCKQNTKYHSDDVFTHCIKACDFADKIFELRAAALFHDIGYLVTDEYNCVDEQDIDNCH